MISVNIAQPGVRRKGKVEEIFTNRQRDATYRLLFIRYKNHEGLPEFGNYWIRCECLTQKIDILFAITSRIRAS